MSNYIIDRADPLFPGFTIRNGAYNGPGGAQSDSSLRLYGHGAPMWGESVDENLLRLLETFQGATPPINPSSGQQWIETKLYFFNTDTEDWYRYNPSTLVWDLITTAVSVSTTAPAAVDGALWYHPTNEVLQMYFSLYKQAAPAWHQRSFMAQDNTPATTKPRQTLRVWDVSANAWVVAQVVEVSSSTDAPPDDRVGSMRFDEETGLMYYWSGNTWVPVASTEAPIFAGTVDMNENKIINLGDATDDTDALNRQTADARYVNLSGDTMTGALTLSGAPVNALHAATKAYVDTAAAGAASGVNTFPSGGIIMWSDFAGPIPSGWVICDGANGTPDLRGRFVLSSSNTYVAGATGGSTDSVAVSHTHNFSTTTATNGSHTHAGTTSVVSDHTHAIGLTVELDTEIKVAPYIGNPVGTQTVADDVNATAAGGSHNHTFTTDAGGLHSHTITGTTVSSGIPGTNLNMPPYYVLAFIMKV